MTKSPARLISFISIAIAINLVEANLALFLRLPIYLDTIGTLLIAVILGPWYAASTAFLSALINWMTTDIFFTLLFTSRHRGCYHYGYLD